MSEQHIKIGGVMRIKFSFYWNGHIFSYRTNSPYAPSLWDYFGNGLGYGTHSTSPLSMCPHDTELVSLYYSLFFCTVTVRPSY